MAYCNLAGEKDFGNAHSQLHRYFHPRASS